MSYLLDRKNKRKKFTHLALSLFVLLILFYFRSGIFNSLSYASHKIFQPFLVLGDNVGGKFSGINSFFASKNSLSRENQSLKSQLAQDQAEMANYNSLLSENANLKEILGRKDEKMNMALAAILGKPNQSPYDTLIIDAGLEQGIKAGSMVFARGNIPIGKVADVYPNSSKVVLFSNPGEKTQAVISFNTNTAIGETRKSIFAELVGRGGGNFEMIMPLDFSLVKGDQAVLPGITPYVLGTVETTISDPRDPFQKALLVSPVNIDELNFVEVEI